MVALTIGVSVLCSGLPKVNPTLVETYKDKAFVVTNTTDSMQQYKIRLYDFDQDFVFYKYGSTDNTLDVTISPRMFDLKPNEQQKVHVEPNDGTDKTRWAVARVRPLKKNTHKGSMEVSSSMNVQIFHYARPTARKVRVVDITEAYFVIKNTGDTPERIKGYYETKNIQAQTVQYEGYSNILVFPYSKKKISIEFDYTKEEKLLLAVLETKLMKQGLKLRLG